MNRHNSTRGAAFARLAAQGMRRSARLFVPWLLAIAGTAAGLYIVAALAFDQALDGTRRAIQTLQGMMQLGLYVMAFFTFIFLVYANSFLFKRRKKELALYQILGMGRRHIAGVLAFETLYTALLGIGGGLLAGIAFYKLAQLAICRLVRFDAIFGITICPQAVAFTAAFFGAALLFLLALNLIRIRRVKPIELLQGAHAGEREPRTRWLLTLLGVAALGGGYWIALRSRDALDALSKYFPAVVLVIVGTYCLFTSVSIAALKLMRRAKGFYYRPNHFISVSGMLYRMKQNAVGMANICILSTMVMVMVSGTVSLYAGTEQMLEQRVPADYVVTVNCLPETEALPDFRALPGAFGQLLAEDGLEVARSGDCLSVSFSASQTGGEFTLSVDLGVSPVTVAVMTAADYARMLGVDVPRVPQGEALAYGVDGTEELSLFAIVGDELKSVKLPVAGTLDAYPPLENTRMLGLPTVGLVVADDSALWRLYDFQRLAYGDQASRLHWENHIDIVGAGDADGDVQRSYEKKLYDRCLTQLSDTGWASMRVLSRAEEAADAYSTSGSFLFLGLFLGFVLLIATVLIIYYKQISEGYDDKARFEIMQKVGLGQREARRTINHQILMVFFLPLAMAGVHMLLDFRMLNQMLNLFNLTDTHLAALCSLVTFGAFSLVYAAVYALTARAYYRIVR